MLIKEVFCIVGVSVMFIEVCKVNGFKFFVLFLESFKDFYFSVLNFKFFYKIFCKELN